ncbi:MAG: amidohydrolase [Peptococcaceae bacterium]|nr:amidohydrolase [Peptococcaceae bacterium]
MRDFYREAAAHAGELVALRRWFHQNPESSLKEFQTSRRIREELSQMGIPYVTAGDTGTIGIIKGKEDQPVLALRADIDALEITERTGADYSSRHEGLMHACGHDAHASALLVAAKILSAHKDELEGTVKLIFQPAEEVGRGALLMIAANQLQDVDAFFGIHVRAQLPVGKIALRSGGVMAGANSLKITVTGESAHGGYPHLGIDAIAAGAAIVEALQHVVSREIPPTQPAVLSVCQFHAGTRDNIIAREAKISGTVRFTSEETRNQSAAAVKRIVSHLAAAHRVKAEVECEYATPILDNSRELYRVAAAAAKQILPDGVVDFIPQLGTEDFGYYGKIAPTFFAFVGSGGSYPHHHEKFDIDEEALTVSAALHLAFVSAYFSANAGTAGR